MGRMIINSGIVSGVHGTDSGASGRVDETGRGPNECDLGALSFEESFFCRTRNQKKWRPAHYSFEVISESRVALHSTTSMSLGLLLAKTVVESRTCCMRTAGWLRICPESHPVTRKVMIGIAGQDPRASRR